MPVDGGENRLSQISTAWTVLRQAQGGPAGTAAQQQILQRYGPAVYRYLLRALGDPHAADDLTQEFGLGLVRGDFHRLTPQRGRFRDYVKTVLFHLVSCHRQRQRRVPQPLAPDAPELTSLADRGGEADEHFRTSWREELLARAWDALKAVQPIGYAVMRLRADEPDEPSARLAERLGRQQGQRFTAAGVRQHLHRAREQFADLLLDEVVHSLEAPTRVEVEDELRVLDLYVYCQTAVQRRFDAL